MVAAATGLMTLVCRNSSRACTWLMCTSTSGAVSTAQAWPQLHDAMRVDKKSRGDRLRFVILDGLAKPSILEAPEQSLLESAYAEVAR